MNSLIKKILKLPIESRNQLITHAGIICEKVSKANIRKLVHKRPGPVVYHAKDDIKLFITILKHNIPDLSGLPDSSICQYHRIIKPLNKHLVNMSR